jgi:glutaredoxin
MYALEVFTRPTCMDCQAGKAFLLQNGIRYTEHDLSKEPEKEKKLIKLTGSRMVPTFVFREKSWTGVLKKPKTMIGFENNKEEIEQLIKS